MDQDKTFESYNWDKLVPEKKNSDYYLEHSLLKFAVKNFVHKFSPKKGFLGLGGRKLRSEKSAIELMVKEGLCVDVEDAKGFIDKFKNKRIDYFEVKEYAGEYKGEYFELIENINTSGDKAYIIEQGARFWAF
ncbi:hypothetical protein HOD29_04235 [archaeon]|jgi:hypothetical protein|nr:hypothetical protein [archaeon]